ncbi:MAG: hypothetical protein WCV86_05030 [Patescibacteria group bacterium]|jgi:hypothetical protein
MIKWLLDILLDTRDVFWRRLSGFRAVPNSIFRVHLLRYNGSTIKLSDGTKVKWGEVFIGIHLDNRRLMRILKEYQPLERRERFQEEAKKNLRVLITYIDEHTPYEEAVAIRARTILAYNFKDWPVDIIPLKRNSWFTRLYRWGLKVNLVRWHPLRIKRIFSKNHDQLQIQDVWMSIASLRTFAENYEKGANTKKE